MWAYLSDLPDSVCVLLLSSRADLNTGSIKLLLYVPGKPSTQLLAAVFLLWCSADLLGVGHGVRGASGHPGDAVAGLALAFRPLHPPPLPLRLPQLRECDDRSFWYIDI